MDYVAIQDERVYLVEDTRRWLVLDEYEHKAIPTGGYMVKKEIGTIREALVDYCNERLMVLKHLHPELWEDMCNFWPIQFYKKNPESRMMEDLRLLADNNRKEIEQSLKVSEEEFLLSLSRVITIYFLIYDITARVEWGIQPDNLDRMRVDDQIRLYFSGERIVCTLAYFNDKISTLYPCENSISYINILFLEYTKKYGINYRVGICQNCKRMYVVRKRNSLTCSKECSKKRYEKDKRGKTAFYKLARNYDNRIASVEAILFPDNENRSDDLKQLLNEFSFAKIEWGKGLDDIKQKSKAARIHEYFADNYSAKTVGKNLSQKESPNYHLQSQNSIEYIEEMRALWDVLELERICTGIRKEVRKIKKELAKKDKEKKWWYQL